MRFFVLFLNLSILLVVAHPLADWAPYSDGLYSTNFKDEDSSETLLMTNANNGCLSAQSQSANKLRRRGRRRTCAPRNSPSKEKKSPDNGGQSLSDLGDQPQDQSAQSDLEKNKYCPNHLYGSYHMVPICDSGMRQTRLHDKKSNTWTVFHATLCKVLFFL